MPPMLEWLDACLGLKTKAFDLTFAQMTARLVVVFVYGLVLVRVADRRFLGRNAGFDVLLGIMLGSILSRAVNGQAGFFATLGVSGVLVLLHHLTGTIACRFHRFSKLVKGSPRALVRDGVPDRAAMRDHRISPDDLDENLRISGNVADVARVAEARLERDGVISVVFRQEDQPKLPPEV
ncbi:MAG TPA: YetF domain-containing protein [Candidatus Didemnitutus sp.]|nr:YetF domain-containing protein [Candidatus Didemnitutus sp.]